MTEGLYTDNVAKILFSPEFVSLSKRHVKRMRLFQLTKEDLLQQTWLALANLPPEKVSKAIVGKRLYYRAIDALRRQRRKPTIPTDNLDWVSKSMQGRCCEFAEDVVMCFRERHPEYGELLDFWLADYPVKEQAELLRISERQVKRQRATIKRLLQKIRYEFLEKSEGVCCHTAP